VYANVIEEYFAGVIRVLIGWIGNDINYYFGVYSCLYISGRGENIALKELKRGRSREEIGT
jgi:hypothetical protein